MLKQLFYQIMATCNFLYSWCYFIGVPLEVFLYYFPLPFHRTIGRMNQWYRFTDTHWLKLSMKSWFLFAHFSIRFFFNFFSASAVNVFRHIYFISITYRNFYRWMSSRLLKNKIKISPLKLKNKSKKQTYKIVYILEKIKTTTNLYIFLRLFKLFNVYDHSFNLTTYTYVYISCT